VQTHCVLLPPSEKKLQYMPFLSQSWRHGRLHGREMTRRAVSHKQPDTETHFLHKHFSTDCSHVSSRHCQQIYSAYRLLRVNMLPWIAAMYRVPEDSCSIECYRQCSIETTAAGWASWTVLSGNTPIWGRVLTKSATGTRHASRVLWTMLQRRANFLLGLWSLF